MVVDVSTMIREKETSAISIYPNPFSTSFTIQMDQGSPAQIEIFNHLGQLVESVIPGNIQQGEFIYTFKASELPCGVYIVKLMVGKEILSKKIVKMR